MSFDLTSEPGVRKFYRFLDAASDLVAKKYRGSLSGEHGDGQSKAVFLRKMFGSELVRAFAEFKAIWDPEGRMNPGKVVRPHRPDEDLRLGPGYDPSTPSTHFAFPDDGGSFAHATLRCVGVGKCRNTNSEDGAVMCPSFMVTEEERHSTRGRAHLLWEMLRGKGPIDGGFRDESVKESLDLCLACKGCKGDCPVNVDVATYKAEFLSHYYEGRVRPRSAYAFGLIDKWARLAALVPGLANAVTQTPALRALAKLTAGVSQKRDIPAFAPETFREWFERRPKRSAEREVVLWVDTFTDHFHPEVGKAAVKVLEHVGFEVVIPSRRVCCGRPLYDFGMLDAAKKYLEDALACLRPHVEKGTPVVVLEPSCASVFRDELGELFPTRNEAKNLAKQTMLLSELLARDDALLAKLPKLDARAVVQTHCHHHAIMRFDAEKKVLQAVGIDADVLASGCCGMAGSFGFESGEKHEVSMAAGERVLLPAVRRADADTLVLANGFSCRTQIEQGTPRRALHLAEALALAIDGGPPAGAPFVESAYLAPVTRAIRTSTARGLFALVLLALLLVAVLVSSVRL